MAIWIFDFDGTLTQLKIDWDQFKEQSQLSVISMIWRLPQFERNKVLASLAEIECRGVISELCIPRDFLNSKGNYGVLTNNSETAVNLFFATTNLCTEKKINLPYKVVGRETLCGPKNNFEYFKYGIEQLRSELEIDSNTEIFYVGDQEYELHFAKVLGMVPINAKTIREIGMN